MTCACGAIARISAVAPIPDRPDRMRHTYHCEGWGDEITFDVMKKAVAERCERISL